MTDPAIAPSAELDPPVALSDPRSEAHLAHVHLYRAQLVQTFRCIATTSAQLVTITETGDPHGTFHAQVAVLDVLVRQAGATLASLRALAETEGVA